MQQVYLRTYTSPTKSADPIDVLLQRDFNSAYRVIIPCCQVIDSLNISTMEYVTLQLIRVSVPK